MKASSWLVVVVVVGLLLLLRAAAADSADAVPSLPPSAPSHGDAPARMYGHRISPVARGDGDGDDVVAAVVAVARSRHAAAAAAARARAPAPAARGFCRRRRISGGEVPCDERAEIERVVPCCALVSPARARTPMR
jgi:hypothetical protein